MTNIDFQDIFSINAEAVRIERERCLHIVDDEPELPGPMPDEMWFAISGNREATQEALREAVRLTKKNIRNRINE